LAFTLHAFHPKALNDCLLNWQVFWLSRFSDTFPFQFSRNSGFADSENTMQFICIGITATGIAPELNRIPILILTEILSDQEPIMLQM